MCVHVLCMCDDASGVCLAIVGALGACACGCIVRVSHVDDMRFSYIQQGGGIYATGEVKISNKSFTYRNGF